MSDDFDEEDDELSLKNKLSEEMISIMVTRPKIALIHIKKLVDLGANLDFRDELTGYTPLITAINLGRLDIAEFLITKFCNLSVVDANTNYSVLDHLKKLSCSPMVDNKKVQITIEDSGVVEIFYINKIFNLIYMLTNRYDQIEDDFINKFIDNEEVCEFMCNKYLYNLEDFFKYLLDNTVIFQRFPKHAGISYHDNDAMLQIKTHAQTIRDNIIKTKKFKNQKMNIVKFAIKGVLWVTGAHPEEHTPYKPLRESLRIYLKDIADTIYDSEY
jgi:hypothetical protein